MVIRAFRELMTESPGGWYSAPQIQAAIGADLGLPRGHSTVRETWRFGKKSLLAKLYLGVRTFPAPSGPEIRYYLRYVDGRISVPADQYLQMPPEERERLFPPPVRTQAEQRESEREAMKSFAKGLSLLSDLALSAETTERLEKELISRLQMSVTLETKGISRDDPEMAAARMRAYRPPSTQFVHDLLAGLKDSGGLPSTRSAVRRTPSRRLEAAALRRQRTPSLPALGKTQAS